MGSRLNIVHSMLYVVFNAIYHFALELPSGQKVFVSNARVNFMLLEESVLIRKMVNVARF